MSARLVTIFAMLAVPVAVAPALAQEQPNLGTDEQRAAGKQLYDKYCSQCHGYDGDGQGVATPLLKPEPRDFTSGKYKIRTTPSGALPTDDDLKNIIRRGMPYTSMPAWPQFTDKQLQNLVYYLKTFSEDFANPEYAAEGMTMPAAPAMTDETISSGRTVYEQLGCIRCHGELGRGDGMSAPTLVDDWGNHIRAADLTANWTFRGGPTREDLFRTFSTGVNGTPMPSYADALSDEERWHLVDYVYSLSPGEDPGYAELVRVAPVEEEIAPDVGADAFAASPEARFPLIGQIVQPGRSPHPMVTDVRVQAIYSRDEIAFLVRWNDLIADRAGTNDPTLVVPPIDPEALRKPAAGDEEGSDDPFADEEEADPFADEEADPFADAEGGEDDFWGEGEDDTSTGGSTSEWSDAVAIQFPMEIPTGIQKPYFLLGDATRPVDLWFVDLARGDAQQYIARGSAVLDPVDGTEVTTSASYDNGEWSVVFRRPIKGLEGITFGEGQFVPVAFSVWDGFNEERGNKRALTRWFYVYVEPRQQISATGPMIKAAFAVLAVELLIVFVVRWRYRRRDSAVGGEHTATA